MSNLREKAREIKAAGEAERGNFEPQGVPKRMYNYWLDKSRTEAAYLVRTGQRRENFCHFWRVVAIWAPLMFLRRNVIETKTFAVLVALAAVALLVFGAMTSGGFLNFLLLALAGIVGAAVIIGLGFLVHKFWPRKWNKPIGKFFNKIGPWLAVGMVAVYVIGAIVAGFLEVGFWVFAWVAGIIVAIAAIIGLFILLTYLTEGSRAKAQAERDQKVHDYIYNNGPAPWEKPEREPGKIKKFFSGVGDFLILIAQVVRVNKWKICPMVNIEK